MLVIKLNSSGIRELLKSPGVVADLEDRASRIAAAAGAGMETAGATIGRNRARATVVTASYEAMLAEATDRALTRAIDAGR